MLAAATKDGIPVDAMFTLVFLLVSELLGSNIDLGCVG
jgi:hypothetical protein